MSKATNQIVYATQIFELRGGTGVMDDRARIALTAIDIVKTYIDSAKPHLKDNIKITIDETIDSYKRRLVHPVQIVLQNSNNEMLNGVHIRFDDLIDSIYTGITFCVARGPVKAGYLIMNTDLLNERVVASMLIMAISSIDSGCDTPISGFRPWLERKNGMVIARSGVDSEIIPNCFLESVPKEFTVASTSSSGYREYVHYLSDYVPAVQQLGTDVHDAAQEYKYSILYSDDISSVVKSSGRFYMRLHKNGIDYLCRAYAQYRSIVMIASARKFYTGNVLYASAAISLEPPVDARTMFTLCLLAQPSIPKSAAIF